MMLLLARLLLPLLVRRSVAFPHLNEQAPCTVLSAGYEAIDDAPAINLAIKECGNTGVILLPEGQIYNIRSPLDFEPCNGCDVQLEGQLLLSNDLNLWLNKPAYINMTGVRGAMLRSVTGSGLIDGNSKTFYQRYRGDTTYDNQPVILPILGSSNITVSGFTIKNAPKQFFRVDDRSSHIRLSNLKVIVENQWWQDIWTRGESIAFQFRNSSNIVVDSVNVKMTSDRANEKVGVCVGVDYSTSDIEISNVYCDNTSDGIHIQFGSVGFYKTPPAVDQWAKNIHVSNTTLNSRSNTGFKNLLGFRYAEVWNVTYDGVEVLTGNPLSNDLCYTISNSRSDRCSTAPGGEWSSCKQISKMSGSRTTESSMEDRNFLALITQLVISTSKGGLRWLYEILFAQVECSECQNTI